jgi:hypothetical protein
MNDSEKRNAETRCIHDMLEGQCSSCKPVPFGINEVVYTTKGGQAFHNWEDCEFLRSGQDFATSKGQANHPINPTKWSNVYYLIGPCEWCCALHHLRDSELAKCEAFINGEWIDAFHLKDRFISAKLREYQVYVEETGLIHFVQSESVRRIPSL